MASFNLIHSSETGKWERGLVGGVHLPNTWPSYTRVKTRWNQYLAQFNIQAIDSTASEWKIDNWLQFVLNSPHYSQFLTDTDNIQIIICGDGLKLLGKPACFLIATLGNFGLLSKCTHFNFVINLALNKETDTNEIKEAFK